MIQSINNLPVISPTRRETTSPAAGETAVAARPPRGPEGLARSIMADGGLSFLRGRLEEKLGALFDKAAEQNPELAAAGPEAFFDTSVDVSPEATADRIVGFALGLKGVFARQNQDLSSEEMMSRFETEIRRGIGEGFGHARGVLQDLDLLDGEIRENVDATWDLVQQKLDNYFHPPRDEESPDGE
jgi:hypothetical protein